MVVLNPTTTSGVTTPPNSSSTTAPSASNSYLSPYLQPLPSDLDPKVSPLAMLTRACNQIESKLMMDSASKKNGFGSLSLDKSLSPTSSTSSSPKTPPARKSPFSVESKPVPCGPLSTSSSVSAPLSCPTPPSSKERSSTASPPKSSNRNPSPFAGVGSLYSGGFPPSLFAPPPSSPCTDPLCRDPSCPTTMWRNSQILQRSYMFPYGLPPPPALFPSFAPPSASGGAGIPGAGPPYTCNWMQGTDFCGRRFNTSDELMTHLRSHTNLGGESSSPPPPQQHFPPVSVPSSSDATLAALQAAQLNALTAVSSGGPSSALAALQAQAAQMCQKIAASSAASLSLNSSYPAASSNTSSSKTTSIFTSSKASPKMSASSSSSNGSRDNSESLSRYHPYSRSFAGGSNGNTNNSSPTGGVNSGPPFHLPLPHQLMGLPPSLYLHSSPYAAAAAMAAAAAAGLSPYPI
ncbi:unnamed protein product [Lepeophtheirus salmonis]|uniref:(salmon louse) hypothetical protein n=1 Tax=Lepeophtheirus salmonis TaxID=72036 RepID=A0A0K2TYW7_LEPSM|nr:unnamed protein product [Lepeophtheirus salmonis]CAF2783412.1 unnamed protein product [Lepeophtheirus salmonis]